MPNNVKTSYLKETKKLNHILTWILKRLKKKKKQKSLRKGLRGFSAILFPVQNVITRNFFIYEAILKNFIPKCSSG